jgi:hypothetical protein
VLIGPVFVREVTIVPRRPKTYVSRVVYGLVLVALISTAWLLLTGSQWVRDTGDFARFGATLFLLLTPLQLALATFFAAVTTAGAVAQEKDRKTLMLLLLTSLPNHELVLGKLGASLVQVMTLLAVSFPIFVLCTLFGGISYPQIVRVYLVTIATVVAAGSLGSTIALWREKTFQALSMTVLLLVLWVAIWEIVGLGVFGAAWGGIATSDLSAALSPWEAIRRAAVPTPAGAGLAASLGGVAGFLITSVLITAGLNILSVARIRAWNATKDRMRTDEDDSVPRESIWGVEHDLGDGSTGLEATAPAAAVSAARVAAMPEAARGELSAERQKTRPVWDNPILWREIRTRAYGRKTLIIRLIYFLLFGFSAWGCHLALQAPYGLIDTYAVSGALAPLLFLSLVLVNAQAVTSLTSERDGNQLDLLLATDLTSKEFVYGKLGGVFFNAKEMLLLPLALCLYLWQGGAFSTMGLFYLVSSLLALYAFVAMVGVHAGMNYPNSRSAIGTSLGTVFFLFLGIGTCMWMMVAFSGSFQAQLQPFLAFMLGGGIGLYIGLGARNPSKAIAMASFLCPFVTFYAVTSFLLGQPHLVFVAVVGVYGFTTFAMLIPAIDEFDVATGRTTAE